MSHESPLEQMGDERGLVRCGHVVSSLFFNYYFWTNKRSCTGILYRAAIVGTMLILGLVFPVSQLEIVICETPIFSAASVCVSPALTRAAARVIFQSFIGSPPLSTHYISISDKCNSYFKNFEFIFLTVICTTKGQWSK
jgi:hypothetical protein